MTRIVEKNRDIKMIGRALRERWPITQETREKIVSELLEILDDPDAKERDKIAASKVLMAGDVINQRDEQQNNVQSNRDRFLEIAERLGIADRFTGDETGRTTCDVITVEGSAIPRDAGTQE